MLAAGVAVRPFGDADQLHVLDAQIGEHLAGDGKLPRAAVDQREVGPFGLGVVFFLHKAREAAGQHLAHHGVVVARA